MPDPVVSKSLTRSGAGLRCPALLTYLRAYDSVSGARASLGRYLAFYNERRPHSSLGARTPEQVYLDHLPHHVAA